MRIEIFITAYLRQEFTKKVIEYIKERTGSPYTLYLLDNGGNAHFKNQVDYYIGFGSNMGIHAAWNVALSLVRNDYFITVDNDLLAPDLAPDWLTQIMDIMDKNPDYAAISMHPHIFIGAAGIQPDQPEFQQDVIERNMCGAVFRIMRTSAALQAGGWERKIDPQRNHEERTICSRLQVNGWKVGITPKIRAYHMFGDNWGYPPEITPEIHGHNPALSDEVKRFDNIDAYDNKTWLPI